MICVIKIDLNIVQLSPDTKQMIGRAKKDEVIREEKQQVQVKWNRGNERALIANVSSEDVNSHFGKVNINARLEVQERIKSDLKRQKIELQTIKMQIESSVKKNKVFNLSLPANRGVKRSGDSKLHFLLQITDKRALLTVVDDYVECSMSVKGKAPERSMNGAIECQKRKQDRRRKKSVDQQIPEKHNDPDFQGDQQDQND